MSTLKPEEYSGAWSTGAKVPDVANGDLKMALRNPKRGPSPEPRDWQAGLSLPETVRDLILSPAPCAHKTASAAPARLEAISERDPGQDPCSMTTSETGLGDPTSVCSSSRWMGSELKMLCKETGYIFTPCFMGRGFRDWGGNAAVKGSRETPWSVDAR